MKYSSLLSAILGLVLVSPAARCIEIANEDLATSRVFSSGFPDAPVRNTNPSFVAAGYDLSGVGWLPGTGVPGSVRVHNLTMITPLHFTTANHYSYNLFEPGTAMNFAGADSVLVTVRVDGIQHDIRALQRVNPSVTSGNDIAIGTLQEAIVPEQNVTAYRLLDVPYFNDQNLPALIYGSDADSVGPRVGTAVKPAHWSYWASGTTPTNRAVEWEGGDSGSPMFLTVQGPNGPEITYVGAAWNPTNTGMMMPTINLDTVTPVNDLLAETGYALKWTVYDNASDPTRTSPRWTGGAGPDAGVDASWSSGAVPANVSAIFDAETAQSATVTLNQALALRGLEFTGTTGFSFEGTQTLSIGYVGIRNEADATQVFDVPVQLTASQNWEANRGDLIVNGAVQTGSGNFLVIGGVHDTTLNGVLSGPGGLAKDDGGTLTINAAATYTGKTFLHSGTVRLGAGGRLGSSDLVFLAPNEAVLDLNGQNQTLGEVSSSHGGTGRILLGGSTLTVSATASGNDVYRGSLEGNGAVVKAGAGTWSVAGTDSHAGTTRIDAGALRLLSSEALSASSNLVLNGGVVELGAGDFTRSLGTGAGQMRFTDHGGFSALGGERAVNLGGAGATLTWGSADFVASGKRLILSSASADATVDFQNGLNLGGAMRTVLTQNGSTAIDARISGALGNGALAKLGAGTLELTGANTYAGQTALYEGVLVAGSAQALGSGHLLFNGGVLGLGAGNFSGALGTGAGQVQFAGHGGFAAFGAERAVNIGGAGATLTWGAANFLPAGSKLTLSSASADATLDFQNGIDLAGATRTIQVDNGAAGIDGRLSGAITNGGLAVGGLGVLELQGANTFSGTLQVNGWDASRGGGVLAGSVGALGSGNLALSGGGVLLLGHSDFTRSIGTGAGQVQFAGSAGFGAYGADRVVNLGGAGQQVKWDTGGFLSGYAILTLASEASTGTLDFRNPLDLNGGSRTINVNDGSAKIDARLSGALNNGGLVKTGNGTLELTGANTYAGNTTVQGGVLRLGSTGAVSASSNINLAGGVLELATGNLTRTLGTGAGQIQFTGNGGFSAAGGDRVVNLNNGATLTWGTTVGFLPNWQDTLILSSSSADSTVVLQNALELRTWSGGNGMRTLLVHDGAAAVDARLAGNISVGTNSVWGINKTGTGTLELSGVNSYTGATQVAAGTLLLSGSLTKSDVFVHGGAEFRYTGAGTLARIVTVEGGAFRYDSSATFSGALDFSRGVLAGNGNLADTAITLGAGRAISPGNSAGTLTTGSQTWMDGGAYLWEIAGQSGVQGTDWDWLNIQGPLDITAGVGGFSLVIDALDYWDSWNPLEIHSWTIATAQGGITGFDPSRFVIDASAFADTNALSGGQFSLAVSGNNLNLIFNPIPEPVSGALVLWGGLALVFGRRRRG